MCNIDKWVIAKKSNKNNEKLLTATMTAEIMRERRKEIKEKSRVLTVKQVTQKSKK